MEIKYPVGIQSFKELREGGYVYVDKTAMIHQLTKGKYYFLSRPRRFGKSLFLSTLEAYYLGQRDLFKGLALDTLTDDWEPHPVFHIDLNNREYKDETSLTSHLSSHLKIWEATYGDEEKESATEERFAYMVRRAYEKTGKKVVILIDEYDKPLLNAIGNEKLTDVYRSQLKAFYSNLKTLDPYIEIALLTGVARFSKVSIFSDLNNLRDISFTDQFSSICGITSEELDEYFREGISSIAEKERISYDEVREMLRCSYDGYHFSEESPDIYNPFSLVYCFANKSISSYWFESGTPTYLVKLLNRDFFALCDIAPSYIDRVELESAGLLSEDPLPVFYQTGYLTIKNYDREFKRYLLDYPNKEVKEGFLRFLFRSYIPETSSRRGFSIPDFLIDVRNGDADGFMKRMESLIAAVPYSDKGSAESHFQNAVYLLFTLMGFYAQMEMRTSDGRMDLRVETERYIFIFEFKIDSTSKSAMDQIEKKRYWLGDRMSNKKIVLIGANFDTKTRRLDTPEIREL
ncbi:MAG: ATP-binding protein [Muribaculaceae bacterium]|nr:ATP-binding protein [Muribaculaceae bacterium]